MWARRICIGAPRIIRYARETREPRFLGTRSADDVRLPVRVSCVAESGARRWVPGVEPGGALAALRRRRHRDARRRRGRRVQRIAWRILGAFGLGERAR